VIPKPDRAYSSIEQQMYAKLPILQTFSRAAMYSNHEVRALAFTSLQIAMKPFEWQFKRHLQKTVKDPILRAKLTPDYPLGCKRILISNHYYQALAQKNVEVETDNIAEVTQAGIKTKDGKEYPVDAIIYGTGFQATDFLAPMKITGRDGIDLNEAWRDGAEAYLGMTVHGFPNMFLLYGPNTNLGHNSILYMLESQFAYILDALKQMRRQQWQAVEVKAQTQSVYNQWVQEQLSNTIWAAGCHSWYKTESGKNTNNWVGFTLLYRYKTQHFNAQDYLTQSKPALGRLTPVAA
jgi:cation diffusion facilitator CzcD-associated flavoprotein CzcO